jgi:hypothetical protein
MELVKALIALLTSFFQSKTVGTVEDIKIADARETAVVSKIAAAENAVAVQQTVKTKEALSKIEVKHKQEREDAKQDPNADANQFTKDW